MNTPVLSSEQIAKLSAGERLALIEAFWDSGGRVGEAAESKVTVAALRMAR
jgi:hypothetical protein